MKKIILFLLLLGCEPKPEPNHTVIGEVCLDYNTSEKIVKCAKRAIFHKNDKEKIAIYELCHEMTTTYYVCSRDCTDRRPGDTYYLTAYWALYNCLREHWIFDVRPTDQKEAK